MPDTGDSERLQKWLESLDPDDMVVRAGVHKLFVGEKVRMREEPVNEAVK